MTNDRALQFQMTPPYRPAVAGARFAEVHQINAAGGPQPLMRLNTPAPFLFPRH
jgi:hypothetical protein